MVDEPMGEVSNEVETPTEDDPTSESATEAVDQQQPEEQSPESETGKNEADDVPKENAAWAAMRAENKRLKEALEGEDPEYLEKLRGATAPQPQYQQDLTPISEDADYSDVTRAVNQTQEQAYRASQQLSRLEAQIELQQDRMAEEQFPELKTDKLFQQLVAEKKLAARVLGREVTTSQIAKEVQGILSRREEQVAAQASETTKQQIAEKQQATAEARGQASPSTSAKSSDELRHKVRKGDMEAQTEVAKGLIEGLEF